MKYVVKLTRGESLVVDEQTGERLKDSIVSGEMDGFFKWGKSMFPLKDVRGVIADIGSKVPDYMKFNSEKVAEFEKNLGRYAKQSVEEKVSREIRSRIRPGLKGVEPVSGWENLEEVIGRFFKENPKYPWCPLREYLRYVFPVSARNINDYYKILARHDTRVWEWVEGKRQGSATQEPENLFDGTVLGLGGGDLDD